MSKTHLRKLQKARAPDSEKHRGNLKMKMLGAAVPLITGLVLSGGGCSEERRYFDVGNRGAELQEATKNLEKRHESALDRLEELAAEKKALENKIERAEKRLERVEEMEERVEESRENTLEAFEEYKEAAGKLLEAARQLETDSQ